MRGNALKPYKYLLISQKIYNKAYSSRCSNELIIAVRWKWYNTPIKVW